MRSRRRLTMLATGLAAALVATLAVAAPAHANTISSYSTYNRPSEVEANGEEYVSWADRSSGGYVNIAEVDPASGSVLGHWAYQGSATAAGTGPTIAYVAGQAPVVAWADGNNHINLAYLAGGGLVCVTDMNYVTPDTPYISTEGDNGEGDLLLTWVDTNLHMNITIIQAPPYSVNDCISIDGFGTNLGATTTLGSDTAWDGPSLVTSGYGTYPTYYWVTWAGTDSGHHLNIAKWAPATNAYGKTFSFVNKTTESTHATLTDMGGAYETGNGRVWISYCGTNNVVYDQAWSAGNSTGGGSESSLSGSCDIFTSGGYYSGGVGVGYDYTSGALVFNWADKNSYAIQRYLVP